MVSEERCICLISSRCLSEVCIFQVVSLLLHDAHLDKQEPRVPFYVIYVGVSWLSCHDTKVER